MEDNRYTVDEEHQSTDEDDHHTTTEDDDHHTTEEDLHAMDEEYGNMAISEYRLSGTGALLRNTLEIPVMKITEIRAKSGECWGLTSAMVKEKFSRAGATINYQAYSITHPFDPLRRKAAKEVEKQKIKLAADKRAKRAAKAQSTAADRIAAAREGRIKTLEEGVH